MIAATLAATALVGAVAPPDVAPVDQLPATWAMGDFGTPIAWQGRTLYVYADIADGNGAFARNAIASDGTFLVQPLNGGGESFYWITDGVEMPDGSLLVSALEVINRMDLAADGWQFEVIDTDLFVVRNPLSIQSWRIASTFGKIEDGWWDLHQVEFSDQHPGLAFARGVYCALENDCRNSVIEFDLTDVVVGSEIAKTPESDGPFAPVETDAGWIGYSWNWEDNSATRWEADSLTSEWIVAEEIIYPDEDKTHAHGANLINGDVVHRWSTIRQRPSYEVVS